MSDFHIQLLANKIHAASNIVALTGAGVSTNAGIPDFRGPQGLYVTRQYDADKIFDLYHFKENPQDFFDFARDFLDLLETINPTFTHTFLSDLEQTHKLKGVITQNIDGLHQAAGSKDPIEIHGSIQKGYCMTCGRATSFEELKTKIKNSSVPRCDFDEGVIKPDIVFFQENVKNYEACVDWIADSDLLLVIGTSCLVQPAGSLPMYCHGDVIIINPSDVAIPSPHVVAHIRLESDEVFEEVARILNR